MSHQIGKSMNSSRTLAIRMMFNENDRNYFRTQSGEIINAWVLVDGAGDVVSLQNFTDEQIESAYEEAMKYRKPNYEEIG
jgi:hypothetical protein